MPDTTSIPAIDKLRAKQKLEGKTDVATAGSKSSASNKSQIDSKKDKIREDLVRERFGKKRKGNSGVKSLVRKIFRIG